MRFLTLAILGTAAIGLSSVHGDAIKRSAVPTMCKELGSFAVTFNQGPSDWTGEILDTCKEKGIRITFHVEAEYLEGYPVYVADLKRAADDGHCIGLFIGDKIDLNSMEEDEMITTIESRRDFIEELIGRKPIFLRVAKPLCDDRVIFLRNRGLYVTAHSMDSYDYNAKSKDDVVNAFKATLDRLSRNTKAPYISAQNGLAPYSSLATGEILDYLVLNGYKVVPLDECLKVSGSSDTKRNSTSKKISQQANGSESIYQSNLAILTIASTMVASAIMTLLF